MSQTPGQSVLDASAVLALLQEEEGAEEVEALLDGALMSCVNLSEVLHKAHQHGAEISGLEYDLEALGVQYRAFGLPDARATAFKWSAGSGMSLGDRACLSLAAAVGGVAITTERRWSDTAPHVAVRVLR